MVLQRLNTETVGLKTSLAMVHLKSSGVIQINDHVLEGPGEYDVAGVGAHVFNKSALLFAEGVRFAFVWEGQEGVSFEEGIDIDVFILMIQDDKQINAIIKEQDPRLVVLVYEEVGQAIAKQDGIALNQESNLKVTAQTLPAGERSLILLT